MSLKKTAATVVLCMLGAFAISSSAFAAGMPGGPGPVIPQAQPLPHFGPGPALPHQQSGHPFTPPAMSNPYGGGPGPALPHQQPGHPFTPPAMSNPYGGGPGPVIPQAQPLPHFGPGPQVITYGQWGPNNGHGVNYGPQSTGPIVSSGPQWNM